jgi:hypothetical protein
VPKACPGPLSSSQYDLNRSVDCRHVGRPGPAGVTFLVTMDVLQNQVVSIKISGVLGHATFHFCTPSIKFWASGMRGCALIQPQHRTKIKLTECCAGLSLVGDFLSCLAIFFNVTKVAEKWLSWLSISWSCFVKSILSVSPYHCDHVLQVGGILVGKCCFFAK